MNVYMHIFENKLTFIRFCRLFLTGFGLVLCLVGFFLVGFFIGDFVGKSTSIWSYTFSQINLRMCMI